MKTNQVNHAIQQPHQDDITASKGKAEFDLYANSYCGGMDDPIKRLIGGSFDVFIALKAKWLIKDLQRYPIPSKNPGKILELLDFGCGTGELMQSFTKQGLRARLSGCDISEEMVKEAKRRWKIKPVPEFHFIENHTTNFPADFFDVITVCCVFHHILPTKRNWVLEELNRVLKPGGRLVIFDHNPLNPITRWMVGRASIDRKAELLRAEEVQKLAAFSNLKNIRVNYFLFFPPRLPGAELADRFLSRIPLGGQYVVVGEKC